MNILAPNHTNISHLPFMVKTGNFIADNETYLIDASLFDSGAQSDNFISASYVEKYINIFKPFILKYDSAVKLGDSKTIVNITHIITLNVSFMDSNCRTYDALLNFLIMPMSHLDMIIGINSISLL